ncbi:NAD(P)/FAD-dependent oxidoreductase [Streptomyces sp. NPDC102360]|uniref:NAD(P)/FAD-dependent oxidoreductase n=1 Tax=Streptomyces sp. NPDC102360 TaxID=3366160 RepID=UPI0037F7EA42
MSSPRVLIAGAGHAGYQVATSLRSAGFDGHVTLVGDEPCLPYQRPPLSKDYLLGKVPEELVPFRAPAFYPDHDIEVRVGAAVAGIDRDRRHVALASGEDDLGYDHLVLALGARCRQLGLPGSDLRGVVELRTRADAELLRRQLTPGVRVAVVGGGFIGLEVAAAARSLGAEVTVLEASPELMGRVLSRPTAAHLADLHGRSGVNIRCATGVAAIEGTDGRVTAVRTATGDLLDADVVVLGVGVVPNTELAADAGLVVDNGIVVDHDLLTSDTAISAIGDCASFPTRFSPHPTRLESVQNAADQARHVAARLTGRADGPYDAVPYFWSSQYAAKLQIAGLRNGHDHTVRRGGVDAFSTFCFQGDRLLAVESVNAPADHLAARKILSAQTRITPDQAADMSVKLRTLVP